jgi:hypothetical protein
MTPIYMVCICVTFTSGVNYKSADVATLKQSIGYYLIPAAVIQTVKHIQRGLSIKCTSIHNPNEYITWPGTAKGIEAMELIMFAAVITLKRGKVT